MRITPVAPEEATGAVLDLYVHELAVKGFIANYTRLFRLRPDVYRAWRQLIAAVMSTMGCAAMSW